MVEVLAHDGRAVVGLSDRAAVDPVLAAARDSELLVRQRCRRGVAVGPWQRLLGCGRIDVAAGHLVVRMGLGRDDLVVGLADDLVDDLADGLVGALVGDVLAGQ